VEKTFLNNNFWQYRLHVSHNNNEDPIFYRTKWRWEVHFIGYLIIPQDSGHHYRRKEIQWETHQSQLCEDLLIVYYTGGAKALTVQSHQAQLIPVFAPLNASQEDPFHPTQTVLEAVMFQALMRLDPKIIYEEKLCLTKDLIVQAGLGGKVSQWPAGPSFTL